MILSIMNLILNQLIPRLGIMNVIEKLSLYLRKVSAQMSDRTEQEDEQQNQVKEI